MANLRLYADALRPFAALAGHWDDVPEDMASLTFVITVRGLGHASVADLRRCREALEDIAEQAPMYGLEPSNPGAWTDEAFARIRANEYTRRARLG